MSAEALEECDQIVPALELHRRCDLTLAKVNPHELAVNADDVLKTRISVHRADTVMQLKYFFLIMGQILRLRVCIKKSYGEVFISKTC